MAGSFDPYHRWLGIPPKDQPPNHYRLLGLELFEDDPDVVQSAADQRMGHLRTFQTGKHGHLSQRLLNEVAAARVCLLNAKKRAAYDELLRQKLAGQLAEAAKPRPQERVDLQLAGFFAEAEKAAPPARPLGAAKKRSAAAAMLIGAAALCVAMILLWTLWPGPPAAGTLLTIQWPEDQRRRGTLEIDGQRFVVQPAGPLSLRCPTGRHEVLATRPGFEPFRQTIVLRQGQPGSIHVVWSEAKESPPPRADPLQGDGKTPGKLAGPEKPGPTVPAPAKTPADPTATPDVISAPGAKDIQPEPKFPPQSPPQPTDSTPRSSVVLKLDRRIYLEPVAAREPPADAKVYLELSPLTSWPIPLEFRDGKSQAQLNQRITAEPKNLEGAEIRVTLLRYVDGFKLRIESVYRGPGGEFSLTVDEIQRRQKTVPAELAQSQAELRSLPGSLRQMQTARNRLLGQLAQARSRGDARTIATLSGQLRGLEANIGKATRRLSRLPDQVRTQQQLCKVLPELQRMADALHEKAQLEYRVFAKTDGEELDLLEDEDTSDERTR